MPDQPGQFSDSQIRRNIRLARDTVFAGFDSKRGNNAKYPDSRFDEFQAFMSLLACGTPQGQRRMTKFLGKGYTPHGDTHLRTIKKYSEGTIKEGFKKAIENLLNSTNVQILQPPVTAAIDITTWGYHAENDPPPEVSGTKGGERRAYKFATLSLVGKSMPIVLAYEPVIESSEWDENPQHYYTKRFGS